MARRFENQWKVRYSPKFGHTSLLLMALPVGTWVKEVREIAEVETFGEDALPPENWTV